MFIHFKDSINGKPKQFLKPRFTLAAISFCQTAANWIRVMNT